MELFKFNPDTPSLVVLAQGEIISGATSVMWTERYRTAGDFEIKAPVSSGLRNRLPIDSLISHVGTTEVMIVENHEISDNDDGDSEIKITGRSLETYLEQKVIGTNIVWPAAVVEPALSVYEQAAGYIWNQAVSLITHYTDLLSVVDDNDALIGLAATTSIAGASESVIRPLKRGPLYPQLLDWLEVADLGLKIVRPGPWSPFPIPGYTWDLSVNFGNANISGVAVLIGTTLYLNDNDSTGQNRSTQLADVDTGDVIRIGAWSFTVDAIQDNSTHWQYSGVPAGPTPTAGLVRVIIDELLINAYTTTALEIHKGVDLTSSVGFSYDSGDLSSGEYLWSNKKLKTSALVTGKWLETIVHGPETGYNRRVMFVDASNVDGEYQGIPVVGDRPALLEKMTTLGQQALAAQKSVAITKAEISTGASKYLYRRDYNIGDIVAVQGNYEEQTTMRVIEHVEIEDKTGVKSYPTLAGI